MFDRELKKNKANNKQNSVVSQGLDNNFFPGGPESLKDFLVCKNLRAC